MTDDSTPINTGQVQTFTHSYQLIAKIITDGRMPSSQKLVLVVLANHANRDLGWVAWPSRELLSAETGLCSRAITDAVKGLERSGLVRVTRNRIQHGVNRYTLHIESISSLKSAENTLMQVRSGKICSLEAAKSAGTEVQNLPTNRLQTTSHLEPATNNRVVLSKSRVNVSAPKKDHAPNHGTSIRLSVIQAHAILNAIPRRLYEELQILHRYANHPDEPETPESIDLWNRDLKRKVTATIRFRGTPQDPNGDYDDLSWTQIVWYTVNRILEGRWRTDLTTIAKPAAYLNETADNASWTDDVCEYSDHALSTAIAEHNARLHEKE